MEDNVKRSINRNEVFETAQGNRKIGNVSKIYNSPTNHSIDSNFTCQSNETDFSSPRCLKNVLSVCDERSYDKYNNEIHSSSISLLEGKEVVRPKLIMDGLSQNYDKFNGLSPNKLVSNVALNNPQYDEDDINRLTINISNQSPTNSMEYTIYNDFSSMEDQNSRADLHFMPHPHETRSKSKACKVTVNSCKDITTSNKKNGHSLEKKIEIIKRINSGEGKSSIAEEYGLSICTIKDIMSKSDVYLRYWNKGLFNPWSKRLKGAKHERLEEVLYFWYKQAIDNEIPISGPILCSKAVDFAGKLGLAEFKATHGWFDRFKKRRKINISRSVTKIKSDKHFTSDLASAELSHVFTEYDSNDIYAVRTFGLFYGATPSQFLSLKGAKCSGGVRACDRLSLLLCCNMTGSEKWPILVVGSHKNDLSKSHGDLPVYYTVQEYSWFTYDIINAWLRDMDSWLIRNSRKILLMVSSSPLFKRLPDLLAIKVIVLRSANPCPLKQLVVPYFKILYRKMFLESIVKSTPDLQSVSITNAPLKLSFHKCLVFFQASWQNISSNIIVKSFNLAGFTRNLWGVLTNNEIPNVFGVAELMMSFSKVSGHAFPLNFEDYVYFDDDLQFCNLLSDDDVLALVLGHSESGPSSNQPFIVFDSDEGDRVNVSKSAELPKTLSDIDNCVSVIRKYIQYQEGAREMFAVLANLEYFLYKKLPLPQINSLNQ